MNRSDVAKSGSLGLVFAIFAESTLTPAGMQVVAPSLPLIQAEFAGAWNAKFIVPMLLTLPGLMIALCAPFMGRLGDRFGVRPLLIGATLVYVTFGVAPFLLDSLYAIIGTRLVFGVAEAAVVVCGPPLIAAAFTGAKRQAMIGGRLAFMGLASMMFAVCGGWAAEAGWRFAFLIYLFALGPLLLVIIYVSGSVTLKADRCNERQPPVLWTIYTICAGSGVLIASMVIYVPYLLSELGIHTPRLAGLLSAVGSSVLIAASLIYPLASTRIKGSHLLGIAFCLGAGGCLVMTFATNWQVVAVGNAIMAAGIGLISPTTMDMVLDHSRPSMRGQATGMMMTGNYIGMFVAPFGIAQAMHMGMPLSQIYGLLALVFIAIAGLGLRIGRQIDPAIETSCFDGEMLERG